MNLPHPPPKTADRRHLVSIVFYGRKSTLGLSVRCARTEQTPESAKVRETGSASSSSIDRTGSPTRSSVDAGAGERHSVPLWLEGVRDLYDGIGPRDGEPGAPQ